MTFFDDLSASVPLTSWIQILNFWIFQFGYLTFEMKYFKFDIYGTHVQVKNVIDQIILPDESIFYKSWGKERNCII